MIWKAGEENRCGSSVVGNFITRKVSENEARCCRTNRDNFFLAIFAAWQSRKENHSDDKCTRDQLHLFHTQSQSPRMGCATRRSPRQGNRIREVSTPFWCQKKHFQCLLKCAEKWPCYVTNQTSRSFFVLVRSRFYGTEINNLIVPRETREITYQVSAQERSVAQSGKRKQQQKLSVWISFYWCVSEVPATVVWTWYFANKQLVAMWRPWGCADKLARMTCCSAFSTRLGYTTLAVPEPSISTTTSLTKLPRYDGMFYQRQEYLFGTRQRKNVRSNFSSVS